MLYALQKGKRLASKAIGRNHANRAMGDRPSLVSWSDYGFGTCDTKLTLWGVTHLQNVWNGYDLQFRVPSGDVG